MDYRDVIAAPSAKARMMALRDSLLREIEGLRNKVAGLEMAVAALSARPTATAQTGPDRSDSGGEG